METQIRTVLAGHARLLVDPTQMKVDDDLYEAGLTSHANVAVMLALEEEFDIEFPDAYLRRSTFASINAIEGVLAELAAIEAADRVGSQS